MDQLIFASLSQSHLFILIPVVTTTVIMIFPSLPGSSLAIFFLIAMRVQHSYNSSTNGWIFT